jgi:16S rRNA processing protein RimM
VEKGAQAVSWIELGVIAKPHGVRGELSVHVFNPDSRMLQELAEVFLIGEEGDEPALVEIESTRQGPKGLLMRLAGAASREDADALPELEEGEYYHADLIGMDAIEGAAVLGKVSAVIDYPSAECLRIERPGGYIEVPMLPRWLEKVDLDAGKVYLKDLADIPLQRRR